MHLIQRFSKIVSVFQTGFPSSRAVATPDLSRILLFAALAATEVFLQGQDGLIQKGRVTEQHYCREASGSVSLRSRFLVTVENTTETQVILFRLPRVSVY